jgi:hypothetical protein
LKSQEPPSCFGEFRRKFYVHAFLGSNEISIEKNEELMGFIYNSQLTEKETLEIADRISISIEIAVF